MIRLHVKPGVTAHDVIVGVTVAGELYPGPHEVELVVGERSLKLGEKWRVAASMECVARLEDHGRVEVIEAGPSG
jgi:hypothetical protein